MTATLTRRQGGGTAPYGWRWESGQLVRDPAEQGPRWLILRAHRQGWTLQRIANHLAELGVVTRAGQQWSKVAVHRVINAAGPAHDDTG